MTKRRFELVGWWLYVLSAIGFIVTSWGNGWAMMASFAFMGGCVAFLLPYYISVPPGDEPSSTTGDKSG